MLFYSYGFLLAGNTRHVKLNQVQDVFDKKYITTGKLAKLYIKKTKWTWTTVGVQMPLRFLIERETDTLIAWWEQTFRIHDCLMNYTLARTMVCTINTVYAG